MTLPFLLLATLAQAADTSPPSWPDQARLIIDQTQILYDSPATTEAELLRREREVRLDLRWPAAQDDGGVVAYRVFHGDRQRAWLGGDQQAWGGVVPDQPAAWVVIPVDAAGNEGAPLAARFERMDSAALESSGTLLYIGTLGSSDDGTVADLFAEGSLSSESLDTLFADAIASGAIAVAPADEGGSGLGLVTTDDGPDTISIRIGHRGQLGAFYEASLRWEGEEERELFVRDGDLRLRVTLEATRERDEVLWNVGVETMSSGARTQLSHQRIANPLSEASLGSCSVDSDYQTTGDLWIEIGVDPRGGQPAQKCTGVAQER